MKKTKFRSWVNIFLLLKKKQKTLPLFFIPWTWDDLVFLHQERPQISSGGGRVNEVTSGICLFQSRWLSGVDITDLCYRSPLCSSCFKITVHVVELLKSPGEWRRRPCVLGTATPARSLITAGRWASRLSGLTGCLHRDSRELAQGDLGSFQTRTGRPQPDLSRSSATCSPSDSVAFSTSSWHALALIPGWKLSNASQAANAFQHRAVYGGCSLSLGQFNLTLLLPHHLSSNTSSCSQGLLRPPNLK